jgi:hypothetical protein
VVKEIMEEEVVLMETIHTHMAEVEAQAKKVE